MSLKGLFGMTMDMKLFKNVALVYAIKVWITTVVLSPMIVQIINFVSYNGEITIDLLFPYAIGFLISSPYFILFCFSVQCLGRSSFTTFTVKTILFILNVIFVTALFFVISGDLFWNDHDLLGIYLVVSSISIFSFGLRQHKIKMT